MAGLKDPRGEAGPAGSPSCILRCLSPRKETLWHCAGANSISDRPNRFLGLGRIDFWVGIVPSLLVRLRDGDRLSLGLPQSGEGLGFGSVQFVG